MHSTPARFLRETETIRQSSDDRTVGHGWSSVASLGPVAELKEVHGWSYASESKKAFSAMCSYHGRDNLQWNTHRVIRDTLDKYARQIRQLTSQESAFLFLVSMFEENLSGDPCLTVLRHSDLRNSMHWSQPPQSQPTTVLESFNGFVNQVEDGIAFVTLESEHGDVLHGEYPYKALEDRGIFERTAFHLSTVVKGDEVQIHLSPSVPQTISEIRHREIQSATQFLDDL